jgi:hypothetical protein
MVRKCAAALFIALVGLAELVPAAHAKGWSGPWYYLPGETWHRRTEVRFRSLDALRQALNTDHFAYLREATPEFSNGEWVKAAPVSLTRHPDDKLTVVAAARFEVPKLPMGRYVVVFCTLGCKGPALGRFAPVFHVNVIEDEAQRALFYWLDDWLGQRRWQVFFSDEMQRLDWMANSARTSNGLQDWRLRRLTEDVKELRMQIQQSPHTGLMFAAGIFTGMIPVIGISITRRRRSGKGGVSAADSSVPI